jgi:DNA-binding transcriptional LysR family regulator
LEVKWLEDFLCLCETRSFRNAADQRFVSQPAFSRRIRALESWIGVDLVDRSSYPVQLTLSGEEFAESAKQMIDIAYQAREDLRSATQQSSEMITIATHPSLAVSFVPEFLIQFRSATGKLGCRIRNDLKTAEFYLVALEHGTCDFLICYHHEALTFLVDPDRFPSRVIGKETLMPMVAGHAAALLDERPLPLVHYAPYTRLGKVVDHMIKRAYPDRGFKTIGEASVAETVKAMVVAGHGIAWLPKSILPRELADRTLVPCDGLDDIAIDIRIYRHEALRKQATQMWDKIEN